MIQTVCRAHNFSVHLVQFNLENLLFLQKR